MQCPAVANRAVRFATYEDYELMTRCHIKCTSQTSLIVDLNYNYVTNLPPSELRGSQMSPEELLSANITIKTFLLRKQLNCFGK